MESNNDDLELMRQIRKGDEDAFQQLMVSYAETLVVFAENRLFDLEEGRDVVQDLFAELWERRANLPDVYDIRAFLFRSVRNKIVGRIRRQLVRDKYREEVQRHNPVNRAIDELLLEKELWDRTLAVLRKAPKRAREVFLLSRAQELSNHEIAERLTISEQTVKNNLTIALNLLRRDLVLVFAGLLTCYFY